MKAKNTLTTNSDDLLVLVVSDPKELTVNEIEDKTD